MKFLDIDILTSLINLIQFFKKKKYDYRIIFKKYIYKLKFTIIY